MADMLSSQRFLIDGRLSAQHVFNFVSRIRG